MIVHFRNAAGQPASAGDPISLSQAEAAFNKLDGDASATNVTVAGTTQTLAAFVGSKAQPSGLAALDASGFFQLSAPTIVVPLTVSANTYARALEKFTTVYDDTKFEFVLQSSMTVSTGAIAAGAAWGALGDAKVNTFSETVIQADGGTSWDMNRVLQFDADSTGSGFGYEFDVNNFSAHIGDADGMLGIYPSLVGGTGNPRVAMGTHFTGAGNYRLTGAHVVAGVRYDASSGAASFDLWNRGFTVLFGCLQHAFGDYGSSVRSFRDLGTHTISIDLSGATNSNAAIVLKASTGPSDYSGYLRWASTSADFASIWGDNTGQLNTTGTLSVAGSVVPATANAYQLGTSANPWASVWTQDGMVHTSDASTKIDITTLPGQQAATLIAGIQVATYRVAQTHDLVEQDVTVQRPMVDENGQPVMTHEPVLNPDGTPVMVWVRSPTKGDRHNVQTPLTRSVQTMQDLTVKQAVPVPRAGRRTHIGVIAGSVKTAGEAAFGGQAPGAYVSPAVTAADGPDGVRYDEILAAAVAVLQMQQQQIAALTAQVAALAPHTP